MCEGVIGRPGCRLSSSEMVLAALFLLSFCKMCECVCVGQKKGQKKVSLLVRCPHFKACKSGTWGGERCPV